MINLYDLTTDQLFDVHHELCGAAHALVMLCLAYLGAHPYGARDAAYLALSDLWEQANAQAEEAGAAYESRREVERAADQLTGVAMVCTGCRKPVAYAGGDPARGYVGGYWYHRDPAAIHDCDRYGQDIKAMVAAGNDTAEPFWAGHGDGNDTVEPF